MGPKEGTEHMHEKSPDLKVKQDNEKPLSFADLIHDPRYNQNLYLHIVVQSPSNLFLATF